MEKASVVGVTLRVSFVGSTGVTGSPQATRTSTGIRRYKSFFILSGQYYAENKYTNYFYLY